jgi:hypothetical protein
VVHNVTKWGLLVIALKDMKRLEEIIFGVGKSVSAEA